MAEDKSKNPQGDEQGAGAPAPAWLKKAKAASTSDPVAADPKTKKDTAEAKEEKKAKVPKWLKEAGEKAGTAKEPEAGEAEPTGEAGEAEPEGEAAIPEWLKKAQQPPELPEGAEEVLEPTEEESEKAEKPVETESSAPPEPEEATPPKEAEPAEPSELEVPEGYAKPKLKVETVADIGEEPLKPMEEVETKLIKKEEVKPETEVKPAEEAAEEPEKPAEEAKPAALGAPGAPSAPVKEVSKKDVFDTAKKFFVSSADQLQTAVDEGITAGKAEAPKVEGEAPKKAAGKAAAREAAPKTKGEKAKTTAEERKQLVEAEKIYQQGLATIRDVIAPSSMDIKYDSLRVEGMYAQSFYVYAYPRYLDTNWLSPIINFDATMDMAQFIYPIDSGAIMKILKKKVAQMQSSMRIAQEKGMVSDPAIETALIDAEELRTSIQRGQEKFFQFGLYFTLYSESEKKIKKIAKQLETILGGKLILTKRAELQMEQGFNSCLPLCIDELQVMRNMNTSPLSSTFPFSSADLTSNEGILYGLNRHNDSLIIFDRFSLENANSVVFAKSGAGKSYAVKLEILRSMMMGVDVIIIDPENEYEALAQTVGGSYLKVSLTADRRINPFDLPAPLEGEDVQPGDLLRQNIITLHGLLKLMMGKTSPEEESIMDKALIDVYALKGITMEVADPTAFPPPTMEDLYDILSTMEGGVNMAQRLQKYTSGTYSGIFNKPTNVELQTGLMVFSIRDLEDSLRPIAMYIILNYIWNRVRSKLKKRILVIDEAWSLMQHEDSAKFLFALVKRARKYFLGITTITQDVEDFVKNEYGRPVVTNSSMQLLLKQAPAAIDMLGKIFDLTQGEKYMLLNSGVGQGLFFAGLKHVAIQIIASYTEDKIVTTNPEEILAAQATTESFETS